MDIAGIGSRLASAVGQGSKKTPESLLGTAAKSGCDAPPADASPLGQILADYDLNQVTPRQLTELLDRLKGADVITPREHQQLTQLRTDLDTLGVKPDEPVDLLAFVANKLKQQQQQAKEAERSGDAAQLSALQATLGITQDQSDWVNKLQAARVERPIAGLNAQV